MDTFCREYFPDSGTTGDAIRMAVDVLECFDLFGFYVEDNSALFNHLMITLEDIHCTDRARMTGML